MRNKIAALLVVLLWMPAFAISIEQPLANPAQEAAARAIFRELKCVVCEGQSLAESDAALAAQMRGHVRQMVAQGRTEAEILSYFSTRYGDKILLDPPLDAATAPLWLAPLLLLLLGIWIIRRKNSGQS